MAVRPWRLLSLCDGYGGTELALRSVARVRTVARVERDAYAAAVLVARMEEKRLDQAPVWDELESFDGAAWRGRVDIVAAGFPCPDFSSAGRRAGVDGEHWLWPEVSRIIRDVGPSWVLLENVPGLVGLGGLTRVLSDLALYGFDAEWGVYSAAAVGAPHKRERFWLVAHAQRGGWGTEVGDDGAGQPDVARSRAALAHAADSGLEGRRVPGRSERSPLGVADRDRSGSHVEDVADTTSVDEREPHHRQRAIARRDTRQDAGWRGFPPGPGDHAGWEQWIAQGGPEPVVRRITDGPPPGLADALHLGGNGLVPQCAAEAWRQLACRLTA